MIPVSANNRYDTESASSMPSGPVSRHYRHESGITIGIGTPQALKSAKESVPVAPLAKLSTATDGNIKGVSQKRNTQEIAVASNEFSLQTSESMSKQ